MDPGASEDHGYPSRIKGANTWLAPYTKWNAKLGWGAQDNGCQVPCIFLVCPCMYYRVCFRTRNLYQYIWRVREQTVKFYIIVVANIFHASAVAAVLSIYTENIARKIACNDTMTFPSLQLWLKRTSALHRTYKPPAPFAIPPMTVTVRHEPGNREEFIAQSGKRVAIGNTPDNTA